MRRVIKSLVKTIVFCLWGIAVVEVAWPGAMGSVRSEVSALLYDQASQIYTITDEEIPLAGMGLSDGVARNGWLRVEDGRLVNDCGDSIQLRGMSSHGLAWYPEYTDYAAIKTTKEHGANVFRAAMYVDGDEGNYNTDIEAQETNKAAMYEAIDNALRLDMYVIADWHILKDGNPLDWVDLAIPFFRELSSKYANEPGVIYEICNEPNGDVTWADIRAYAEQVIPAIRQNEPDAIIIVGTPNFSTDLQPAIEDPLDYKNVMYAYHFYSGFAKDGYLANLDSAMQAKLPVFVSEWGVGSDASVKSLQSHHAVDFLAYAKENKISWVNWSLSNKKEPFSAIRPEVEKQSGWQEEDLTTSGKIAFQALGE